MCIYIYTYIYIYICIYTHTHARLPRRTQQDFMKDQAGIHERYAKIQADT